jgi:hypothetical protein
MTNLVEVNAGKNNVLLLEGLRESVAVWSRNGATILASTDG